MDLSRERSFLGRACSTQEGRGGHKLLMGQSSRGVAFALQGGRPKRGILHLKVIFRLILPPFAALDIQEGWTQNMLLRGKFPLE